MPAAKIDPIICTVDVVLLCLHEQALHVLLQRREREPFKAAWALPGGYIHAQIDQDARDAAERVLRDKLGVSSPYLEQLATFSGPGRDPRGWSVSIAYFALVSAETLSQAQPGAELRPITRLPGLPFDHKAIVDAAAARLRTKSLYSSLPVHLLGPQFTLPQLQAVYEAVLGERLNKVSFRRKVDELGMLQAIPGAMEGGRANRPAQLYRLRPQFVHSLSLLERGLGARG